MPATSDHVHLPDRYGGARRIARGGMATVYLAEDTLLGRPVAVKVLAAHFAADAAARERFGREARAAARLSDHPHVVTIYDIGEHDGLPFIVMEHFAGGTVAERMRPADPVPRGRALGWLAETASALDHAHRHGIVHRDVKPANLLLDEHGRLAVADFGIARMAGDGGGLTQTGKVLGTAAYLAPEQALGRPATAASDLYALAVVAYELLTGRRPFAAEQVAAQARAHVEAEPPAPSDVAGDLPVAVDRVLWRGLDKEPERRWRSAATMIEALEDALGAGAGAGGARTARMAPPIAAAAHAEPPPAAVRPRSRHSRAALAAAALLVLVAGVAIAAFTAGGEDGTPPRAASFSATAARADAARADAAQRRRRARSHARATPTAPAQPGPQTTAPPAATTAPAPAPSDPSALEAQGHQLIAAGQYDQAIGVLQQVTQGCAIAQTDPCAYAYYDLGHALRLAGRPAEAIPVLQTRLQNPDQAATVQAELLAAQQAAGRSAGAGSGQAGRGSKPGRGHGRGPGPSGPPGHGGTAD